MTKVRTRFAPSPTGFMHVGAVRTALFAWLLARQNNGQFILRIEDTDKVREVEGSESHIKQSLDWLGLAWDEGVGKGGGHAPYRQSERLEIYKAWANKLIEKGRAYTDPYTKEELEAFREHAKASKQPFLYRNHRPENPPAWDGTTALRLKSEPKSYRWQDAVMGEMASGPEAIDDFILIKADGYPTYNFCHIVDDALMEVTHILRSQEFVSSTPKFLNLYEALEITPPILATLPFVMAIDGKKKLSKRDGAKDVLDYAAEGYLPEALLNFLATLGWNDGTEQEIFSVEELIEKFSLEHVQTSPARFDEQRLLWLNGQWIRRLELGELYKRSSSSTFLSDSLGSNVQPVSPRSDGQSESSQNVLDVAQSRSITSSEVTIGEVQPEQAMLARREAVTSEEREGKGEQQPIDFWPKQAATTDESYKKQVLALMQDRLKALSDLKQTGYFFADPKPDMSLIETNKQLKKLAPERRSELLQATKEALENTEDFTPETIQTTLNQLLETTSEKPGTLFSLIRTYLTWAPYSPQLNDTIALLGKETVLRRLQNQL